MTPTFPSLAIGDDPVRILDGLIDGFAEFLRRLAPDQEPAGPISPGASLNDIMAALGFGGISPSSADEARALRRLISEHGTNQSISRDQLLALVAGTDDDVAKLEPPLTGFPARLLRARCRLLGLLDAPPSASPWQEAEFAIVRQQITDALYGEPLSNNDVLGLLRHPARLLDRLWTNDPHGYVVVDPTGTASPGFARLFVTAEGDFAERRIPFFRESNDGPRNPNLRDARIQKSNQANRLALRIIQVRLWQLGLLPGPPFDATDYRSPTSAADRQRLTALIDALRLVVGSSPAAETTLRLNVEGAYCAINLKRLASMLQQMTRTRAEELLVGAAVMGGDGGALLRVVSAAREAHDQLAAARAPVRHFLLGRPLKSEHLLAQISLGGDAVVIGSNDITAAEAATFVARIRQLCRGLDVALAIAALAIGLVQSGTVVLGGPAAWGVAAVRLARDIHAVREAIDAKELAAT